VIIRFLSVLVSVGLMTASVATAAQTRSGAAIPAASLASVANARTATGAPVARQGVGPDCALKRNKRLPICGGPGGANFVGGGAGGGASGGILAGLAAALGVGGPFVALKRNDSAG